MQNNRAAVVLGATGLTGAELVSQLLNHPSYQTVRALVRKPLDNQHPKLTCHVVDFERLSEYAALFNGDDIFCCLGTTMAKAGSKDAFYQVDFNYPYEAGILARKAGATQYILVSSVGADSTSSIFYSRVKGKLEEAICEIGFPRVQIMQPGVLVGSRKETRMAESAAIWLTNFIDRISRGKFLGKYRPSPASVVAASMIEAALHAPDGQHVYPSDELYSLVYKKYTWTTKS
jgi:uncharacterized protein YbjT (DUF2867 family)